MQELAAYIEHHGYHQENLPKEIRELRLKVKRTLHKYPSSKLLKERIEQLVPDIFEEPKDENYTALLVYVAREGHSCPPTKHIENGKKIGLYVSNTRQKYKNGLLSLKEKEKYECLHGWKWNIFKTKRLINEKVTKS